VTSPKPASAVAPDTGDLSEVLSAARILWPPPLAVTYARGRSHAGSLCEQILLPGPASPRICVPGDTRLGAARAIMRFSSALPPRQIAARLVSALSVRLGPRSLTPHRLVVSGATTDSLRDHLSLALGRPVSFGFGIGTARANRKPVLALFGKDGSRLGFAKIGVDAFTDEQVTREANALKELERGQVEGIRTPALLDFGTWEGHPVLVMGALAPSPWETARRAAGMPTRQMEALGRAFGVREAPLSDCAWWTTLIGSVTELPDGDVRSDLLEAMDVTASRWAGLSVRAGAWHGDWTPWNMGWSRGKLLLWDFERFEVGAPIGLDVCHFAIGVPAASEDPQEILRRLEEANPCDDPDLADLVKTLYLIAITSRYQIAAHSENGRLIAPRAAIMARCLTAWLSRTADGGVRV
jgi:hypothetical protein